MSGFSTLLATIYVCEAMLASGPLPKDQALRCTVAYETLMMGFLSHDERQAVRTIATAGSASALDGFERFQSWERDNAALVEQFKDEARTIVQTMR